MKILVNGAWRETAALDLDTALQEFGYSAAVVATAVNGEFIPAASRAKVTVRDGDRVEVLAPMQGG